MTTLIPDSWEMPPYVAGDLVPMSDYEDRRRDRITDGWENAGDKAPVVNFQKAKRYLQSRPKPAPEPRRGPDGTHTTIPPHVQQELDNVDWSDVANRLGEIKPYDPSDYPDRDFYDQADLDHLSNHGFFQAEPGVWHRHVTDAQGQPMAGMHILTYEPGHRRPTNDERAPWVLTTDPDTVGLAFGSLRGDRGAMAAANADRDAIRRMSKVGAGQSPARRNIDDWLAQHTDESFEHAPESNEDWMNAREGDEDEGYTHWEPHDSDYPDYGDAVGQSFRGDDTHTHVMPGSRGQFGHGWEEEHGGTHDVATRERASDHYHNGDDDESGDLPEHEQHLEDLGFNWQNRGNRDTTPVGEYMEGEYVRHQHDPEGNHIATHTLYRDPNGRSDMQWHLEHSPADMPDFAESHTTHRFPHDAISYYHHNAEQALLPQRGYEPHRAPSGVIAHWTRVDTDPQSGAEYHHEISNQPSSGEGNHQGWLGQTFGDHMNRSYAPNGARNQSVQPDLADVVREHDRIGRGLHPGGSQDYRTTRDELLSDPSVARLGTPHWVSDSFYNDGKVGKALWTLPHPTDTEHPINAEATYNWDKGGYDIGYTHDGIQLHPNQEHFPAGAPVHVPGRQTRLPLEGAR